MKISVVKKSEFDYYNKEDVIKNYKTINGWFEGYEFSFSEYDSESESYKNTESRDLEFFNEDHTPEKFIIYLNYPLSVMAKAEVEAKSNLELAIRVADMYHQIYKEENESTEIPEGTLRNMYNRNTTNGKYGIWGHVLGDLVLEGLQIHEGNIVTVYVGS